MVKALHWGDLSPDGLSRASFETRDVLDLTAAGTALFQEVVDRILHVCHKRIFGATTVLDYKPGSGDAWHLDRATPGPNGVFIDDTDQPGCDDDLTEPTYDTFTPTRVSFTFRNVWVAGSVSRLVIERGRGFMDVLADALVDAAHRAAYGIEIATFQGNFGTAAPKEFDGLFELINAYNGTAGTPEQVFIPADAVGDLVDTASVSGNLQLEDLDKAIDELKPGPKVIFASKAGSRVINSRLVANREYNPGDRITIRGGFRVVTYDDHPIVKTDGIGNAMGWAIDASSNPILTALTGAVGTAATTAIVVVNTDDVFYAELLPMTVEDLGSCTVLRAKFEGLAILTLVQTCPEGASMIIGIKSTP